MGEMGQRIIKRYRETYGVVHMFTILTVVMVSQAYTYVKAYLTVYFKYVCIVYGMLIIPQ